MMAKECGLLGGNENILNLILVQDLQHNSVNTVKPIKLYMLNG